MDVLATELHKQARRNFPRTKVIVLGINDLWQADLVEMQPYAKQNKGYRYLLTCINVMSKYAWAVPTKSKTGKDVTEGFRKILNDAPTPPRNLQVDSGGEFYNKEFQALMKKHGINMYSTFSEKKASVVERFNRTLKSIMWKQFTRQGNYKWTHILDGLLDEYNNRVHSTIKMKPADVTESNEPTLRRTSPNTPTKNPKFKLGDKVRISTAKKIFDKGYLQNWTNEIFVVSSVQNTEPVTYLLKDALNENVQGSFYEQELLKTTVPDFFLVEKVIRKRKGKDGKMLYLVKWKGYDSKHNSWVDSVENLS